MAPDLLLQGGDADGSALASGYSARRWPRARRFYEITTQAARWDVAPGADTDMADLAHQLKRTVGPRAPERQRAPPTDHRTKNEKETTMQTTCFRGTTRRLLRSCTARAALLALAVPAAHAASFDTDNPDLSIRWDNTVKAGLAYRLHDADPALANSFNASGGPQALNLNAGDQNFRQRGLVSQRLDLLSEFDVVWQRSFGARVSAAAWYDRAYNRKSDAVDEPLLGQTPYNEFPDHTRRIAGRKAEFLDAFVFGTTSLGSAGKISARLGQHTLLFGETLFLGDNGVAAAQGPVDIQKLLGSPNAQFKEIAQPVPQLSTTWQLRSDLSLAAYYQFRWKESRVPPSGSYFSSANLPWNSKSPEFVNVPAFVPAIGGNYVLTPGADERPRSGGQFGLQLKWRLDETDVGFFYARYHDKFGQLFGLANVAAKTTGSRWYYVFAEDIDVAGVSASRSVGDFNLAVEASVRDKMPLNVNNAIYFGPTGTPRPALPVGRTAHLNLSALATFGPNLLAQESSFVGELAWNRVLNKSDPNNEIDKGRTRDATILQFIYSPTYRQALAGLDLSVPLGLRYTLDGQSSVTAWGARKTGSVNIGLEGNYLNAWQFGLSYTHYIGAAVPFNDYAASRWGYGNPLADRDYVSLNVRRTF